MRHRRHATGLVAAGLGLSALALAGCASPSTSPAKGGASTAGIAAGSSAGGSSAGGSSAAGSSAGGQVPSAASSPASTAALSACSLLRPADVVAVAATFPHETITIDGHHQGSTPPTNTCGFNQKGVFTQDGMTSTLSGDSWARLTVVTGGASYAFSPAGNDTIPGFGDGAYWEAGTHTVVIRRGQDVLQVSDEVPADPSAFPDLATAYRRAAQALAAKILSHL